MKRHIKHHHLPGDIPKREKISLLENGVCLDGRAIPTRGWKKVILMKERAVLKRRFQRMLDA